MKKSIEILLMILFISVLVLTGCTKENQDKIGKTIEDVINEISIDSEFSDNFTLPGETPITKVPIEWSSSNPDILSADGYSYIQKEDKDVVLTAEIMYKDQTLSKDFIVKVKADTEGLFNVAWEYYEPKLPDSTVKDFKVITRNYGEFNVEYSSSNEEIISRTGEVHQTNVDQVVTFTVTIIKGNERQKFMKDITLTKYTDAQLCQVVLDWVGTQVTLFQEGLISELPTTHPTLGTTIVWSSSEVGTISPEGELIKPVDKMDVSIKYEVRSNERSLTNAFEIKNFGGASVEEFLDNWLPTQMPTSIKGSVNHVWQEYLANGDKDYYLNYQEYTNVGGVLNLIDGKTPIIDNTTYYVDVYNPVKVATMTNKMYYGTTHRTITEDELQAINNKFGHNYEIVNDDNIMFITVHESGMAIEGQDVNCLGRLQYNNAYVTSPASAREASWHYQVDAYHIYQSFDDRVECWHSGERYGNLYGIGIEMCINQDGNYEGAMRNDAKLIAYLMHKHNLKLENVLRHYDFSGKECPSYMIRTNRWNEFIELVSREYIAMKYLSDATVTWTVSDMSLFEKGDNNLLYNKEVSEITNVDLTLEVTKGDYHFKKTTTLTLYPNE